MPPHITTRSGMRLLDARDYPAVARQTGLPLSPTGLILSGDLIRLHVGRIFCFRWDDILAVMPAWAQKAYAAMATRDPYPVIVRERADLHEQRHTITVERVDRDEAYHWAGSSEVRRLDGDYKALIGRLAVIERHHGRLAKVCAIRGLNGQATVTAGDMERLARAYAHGYGATYVAVGR